MALIRMCLTGMVIKKLFLIDMVSANDGFDIHGYVVEDYK